MEKIRVLDPKILEKIEQYQGIRITPKELDFLKKEWPGIEQYYQEALKMELISPQATADELVCKYASNGEKELNLKIMEEINSLFPANEVGDKAKENFLVLCKDYLDEIRAINRQNVGGGYSGSVYGSGGYHAIEHRENRRAEIHNKIMEIFQVFAIYASGKSAEALKILFKKDRFSDVIFDYFDYFDISDY